MTNIKDKKFIVTGSSRGIGLEIAKQLSSIGAKIVMSSSSIENLQNGLKEIENKENCHLLECDVSQSQNIEKFIKDAVSVLGGLDGIVCNAGVTQDKLSLRMSEEDWDKVCNINLKSVFLLNKHAFRHMMKNSWGRIVNISSIVAATGNPGQANYCAAKGGMISMSKSLALEYVGKNVTVNCVSPGFIDTDMTRSLTDERKDFILSNIPMKRQGSAEEIANMVNFILSEASNYITGQVFHVNGGMYMQ
ncbi:3-oxoacyl-[acyl-carrier-protein] reductase [Anaplasmataceae bacterium AB001_6]|nr:3-oxoacyl-[acyl-carrier-protein] reductase [Anaplasmataceae bacterium AB001_6]